MMMDVDDKKGKKKMFPEEEEKIDTATTTTTTSTTEDMMMGVDHDHDDDDDKEGKKKMSPEEEEAEKLRIEKLVGTCSYYGWAQDQYSLRLGLDKNGNKIVKKNSAVSVGDDHGGGSSSSSVCRDEKNQVLPPRKRVLLEVDAEKHHHHHHNRELPEKQNSLKFRIPLKGKPDGNPKEEVSDENPKEEISDENPNEEVKCIVCGRNFHSKKSLYGHMRSHPRETLSPSVIEQISSPYSSPSPSRSVVSADSMNKSSLNWVVGTELKRGGLELALPQWLKKEKRGRRSLTKEEAERKKRKRNGAYTGNKQQTPLLHEKDRQGDGDQDLVITGKQSEKPQTGVGPVLTLTVDTQGIDEEEVANNMATWREVVINSKAGLDDEKVVNISDGSDQYKAFGIVMENESFRSEKPCRNSNMLPHDALRQKFTLENKVKVEGGINATDTKQKKSVTISADGPYKCSECTRSFSTHQALGGHKSSHSIKKTKDVPALTNGATLEHGTQDGLAPNSVPHPCKVCGKLFPSGQALGGHQRSHYVAVGKEFTVDHKTVPAGKDLIIDVKPAPVMNETTFELKPAAVVQELNFDIRAGVEHSFDLNEMPVMEGEEVDIACTALSLSTPQPIQAA